MTLAQHPFLSRGSGRSVDRVLDRLRTSTCTIQRPVSDVDPGGAPIESYGTIRAVRCRISIPGRVPSDVVVAGQVTSVIDYEVHFPRDVDVRSNDRILANDRILGVVSDRDAISFGTEVRVLVKAYES